jgi:hypothetical protein
MGLTQRIVPNALMDKEIEPVGSIALPTGFLLWLKVRIAVLIYGLASSLFARSRRCAMIARIARGGNS